MNKKDLTSKVAQEAGLTKKTARQVVDALLSSISGALQDGDKVMLVGFGTFDVAHRRARKGRNPQTGEDIQIPAKKTPRFRPGKNLMYRVS